MKVQSGSLVNQKVGGLKIGKSWLHNTNPNESMTLSKSVAVNTPHTVE